MGKCISPAGSAQGFDELMPLPVLQMVNNVVFTFLKVNAYIPSIIGDICLGYFPITPSSSDLLTLLIFNKIPDSAEVTARTSTGQACLTARQNMGIFL
jgi:hypothetical protein